MNGAPAPFRGTRRITLDYTYAETNENKTVGGSGSSVSGACRSASEHTPTLSGPSLQSHTASARFVVVVVMRVAVHRSTASASPAPPGRGRRRLRRRGVGAARASATAGDTSWGQLEASVESEFPRWRAWREQEAWRVVDTALRLSDPPPSIPDGYAVLFRDRNGWCPYSERAWCGLAAAEVPFVEVLVDNQSRKPSWYSSMGSGGSTPCVRWPDGQGQGESLDILRAIDDRCDVPPGRAIYNYAPGKTTSEARFVGSPGSLFPRGCRPSSRCAFLYDARGEPLSRDVFEASLDAVDAVLAEDTSTPFFDAAATVDATADADADGFRPSVADFAWAPFLERYATQVSAFHPETNPRDADRWQHLAAWYDAMDDVPWYTCRVAGDPSSWAKVLAVAGYGNSGDVRDYVPPAAASYPSWAAPWGGAAAADKRENLWRRYAASFGAGPESPSPTLGAHVAGILAANRKGLVRDFLGRGGGGAAAGVTEAEADAALLRCASVVMEGASPGDTGDAGDDAAAAVARYLGERLCVPRDMGAVPAAHMRASLADLVVGPS